MESIYQNFFDFMYEQHGLTLVQSEMRDIVEEAVKLHDEIQQQEYYDKMSAAIDAGGGCSRCGDLDGYSCICDDDEEEDFHPYDDEDETEIIHVY